jgi:hypothetical protein
MICRPNVSTEVHIMTDFNVVSTAAISGVVAILVAGVTTFTTIHVTNTEIAQKSEELRLKRRSERLAVC